MDDEIRQLYVAAQDQGRLPTRAETWKARRDEAHQQDLQRIFILVVGMGGALSIGVPMVATTTLGLSPGHAFLIATTLAVLTLGIAKVATWSRSAYARPIGPYERDVLAKLEAEQREHRQIDPFCPHVVRTVVRYVAAGPLTHCSNLLDGIRSQHLRLTNSLIQLRAMADDLRIQSQAVTTENLRDLIDGKLRRIRAVEDRISGLIDELAGQAGQAEEAVRPVRELVDGIERLLAVDENLTGLESGYGLVASAEEHLSHNRVELQLLQAAVCTSAERLQKIERDVDAFQRAELEVDSLRTLAAPVPDVRP